MEYSDGIAKALEIYTFSEILEYNDVTEEEALTCLYDNRLIRFPNPELLDFNG